MLDDTSIVKSYLAPAKWDLIKRIVNNAMANGHRIEILVATGDGGEIAGIPHFVVQGMCTKINISQSACRFVNLADDTLSVDTEVRFSGVSTFLSLHVGVIAGFMIENVEIPLQLPCWPIECVLGKFSVEPTPAPTPESTDTGSNVISLFDRKKTH